MTRFRAFVAGVSLGSKLASRACFAKLDPSQKSLFYLSVGRLRKRQKQETAASCLGPLTAAVLRPKIRSVTYLDYSVEWFQWVFPYVGGDLNVQLGNCDPGTGIGSLSPSRSGVATCRTTASRRLPLM